MPDTLKDSRGTDPSRDPALPDMAPSTSMLPDLSARTVFSTTGPGPDDAAVLREDEANMRRALGMLGGSPRPAQLSASPERRATAYNLPTSHSAAHADGQASPRRHRFVQDGDVSVTVVRAREHAPELSRAAPASPVSRIDALQASLAAEQAARGVAERALEEAQGAIRTLQTRLSHLELARDEAVAQAQQAQAEAVAAKLAETTADAERRVSSELPASAPVAATTRVAKQPKRAARPAEPKIEPEPVKWWLSSQALWALSAKRRKRSATTLD